MPSLWRTLTQAPYPAVGPTSITTPSATDTMGSDRVGQVDAAVQDAPAVAEAGGPHTLGGHHEQRTGQAGLAFGALLSERCPVRDLLAVYGWLAPAGSTETI